MQLWMKFFKLRALLAPVSDIASDFSGTAVAIKLTSLTGEYFPFRLIYSKEKGNDEKEDSCVEKKRPMEIDQIFILI